MTDSTFANLMSILGVENGNYGFSAQYEYEIVQSNGTSWFIISKYNP